MHPKASQLAVDPQEFLGFCRLAFGEKRKTLFNNLRKRYEETSVRRAIASGGMRDDTRAETLSLEQLALIYRFLRDKAGAKPAAC